MKNLSDFIDQYGFIVHHDQDGSGGGDSAQRTFGKVILDLAQYKAIGCSQFSDQVNLVTCHGDVRRHWDPNFWPGQPGYGSRDNFAPLMLALRLAQHSRRFEIMNWVWKRCGFLWNTKKIGQHDSSWKVPDFIGGLLPLIIYGKLDLACKYMSVQCKIHLANARRNPGETSDDLNFQLALHTLQILGAPIQEVIDSYCFNRAKLDEKNPMLGYQQAIVDYFASPIAPPLDVEYINASIAANWLQGSN